MKRAIVTGCRGQDGSFLAEYLISLDYDVYGVYRRVSAHQDMSNISSILNHPRLHLMEGDICDSVFMFDLIQSVKPDEFYNLAAQSHVHTSFKEPIQTFRVNAESVIIQLEAIRKWSPNTKYYQASTSEIMGGLDCPKTGYTEESPANPRSPYALSKTTAYNAVHLYKQSYGIFGCNGILFNHSSQRRPKDFATRKITHGIASVKLGLQDHLYMGNMEACRDEGHSADYVRAMHLMLQQDDPEDYIVATGTSTSIKDMFEYVCSLAGLKFEDVYRMDERFMRPSDVPYLLGDSSKIKKLGWEPIYNWKTLLKEMYEYDLCLVVEISTNSLKMICRNI